MMTIRSGATILPIREALQKLARARTTKIIHTQQLKKVHGLIIHPTLANLLAWLVIGDIKPHDHVPSNMNKKQPKHIRYIMATRQLILKTIGKIG